VGDTLLSQPFCDCLAHALVVLKQERRRTQTKAPARTSYQIWSSVDPPVERIFHVVIPLLVVVILHTFNIKESSNYI